MKRSRLSVVLSAGVLVTLSSLLDPTASTQAAVVVGGRGAELLIGRDDDNIDNTKIQDGATADQSLSRTDVIEGGPGNDVMFGLNGDDMMDGGPNADIILGGPDGEQHPAALRTATSCSVDRATM